MAVTGMIFTIDYTGKPIAQYFPDSGANPTTGVSAESNAQTMNAGDWQLAVTGVPAGTAPATIAALILSSPVAIPLPFKSLRWSIAYSSLGSACTATAL